MPCILVSASLWFRSPGGHADLLCSVPGTYKETAMARSPSNLNMSTESPWQSLLLRLCLCGKVLPSFSLVACCKVLAWLRVAKSALRLGRPGLRTATHMTGASSSTLLLDPAICAWITSLRRSRLRRMENAIQRVSLCSQQKLQRPSCLPPKPKHILQDWAAAL